jgi:hypothetical protein
MRFLLLIHCDEKRVADMSRTEITQVLTDCGKVIETMKEAGTFIASARLRPGADSTSVREKSGKTLITDGPFAEAKEALGGFYMIDVKDRDEALAWTAKLPHIKFGAVEVRPVWEPEDWEPNQPSKK